MKKIIILCSLISLVFSSGVFASDTFEAPVPDGGKSVNEDTKGTVSLLYENSSFQDVIGFFEKEVKSLSEIKWQHIEEQNKVVVYDWANRKWHRINIIDQGDGKGVLVEVRKDSWTWIIGTLIIRFVGVFIVLIVLMIALIISGKLLPMIKDEPKPKKA